MVNVVQLYEVLVFKEAMSRYLLYVFKKIKPFSHQLNSKVLV